MTTLVIASRNRHKVREIREILGEGHRYLTLDDFEGAPEIEEDGETFEENAIKKSKGLAHWLSGDGMRLEKGTSGPDAAYVIADDSGLEVDALNGAPGVFSARFAADETGSAGNSTDAANNAKLLRLMGGVSREKRSARFRCVIAVTRLYGEESDSQKKTRIFAGTCEGRIALTTSGVAGFGYDPLFIPDGFDRTFAELGEDEKNKMSHRSRALEALRRELRN